MSSKLALIQSRLEKAFSPQVLHVENESDKHKGHAGYQDGNRHFAITIKADCFKMLSRVAAHRLIYALFEDLIPEQIHALRINIVR